MYRTDGRVSWPVKLWYAAGQTGQSVSDFGFGTLLFIYYNQVLGLSGSYTGLGVAIALFFDALFDPAVGSWSDGFQSKWGRRHLFMAAAILPLGLMFFGLFWPPEGLSQMQLFVVVHVVQRTGAHVADVFQRAVSVARRGVVAGLSGTYADRRGAHRASARFRFSASPRSAGIFSSSARRPIPRRS